MTREEAIDVLKLFLPSTCSTDLGETVETAIQTLSAEPESWKDERKKIADALSEKMAYMNTCLNERDIILSYLGVKRPNETHCNSDCRNEKCKSYHYATKEKGKWIDEHDPLMLKCSECGYRVMRYNNTNFCPNCGADMRGDRKNGV